MTEYHLTYIIARWAMQCTKKQWDVSFKTTKVRKKCTPHIIVSTGSRLTVHLAPTVVHEHGPSAHSWWRLICVCDQQLMTVKNKIKKNIWTQISHSAFSKAGAFQ
jgi:hypothetical protein